MPPEPVQLQFPIKGLHEGTAYSQQPPGTTPDCLNVRPWDTSKGRLRGGQRPGLSKYFASQVNGSNTVQGIGTLVRSPDPNKLTPILPALINETFTYDNNDLLIAAAPTVWTAGYYSADSRKYMHNASTGTNGIAVASNQAKFLQTTPNCSSALLDDIGLSERFIVGLTVQAGSAATNFYPTLLFRVNTSDPANNGFYSIEIYRNADDETGMTMRYHTGGEDAGSSEDTVTAFTIPNSKTWGDAVTYEFHFFGSKIGVYCEDAYQADLTVSGTRYATHGGLGIGQTTSSASDGYLDDFYVYRAESIGAGRETVIAAVSGGDIYAGNPTDGLSVATNGNDVMIVNGHVHMHEALQKMYFTDGQLSSYRVFDPTDSTVAAWAASDGAIPSGGSTGITLKSITDANTVVIDETDLGLSDGDYLEIRGSVSNDGSYRISAATEGGGDTTIDFYNNLQDITDTTGSYYVSDSGCKFITLYRGRIVLYGLETDPHNWFMSTVDNALDWNYFPTTTSATMAVAGSVTTAGRVGDAITCMVPHSDDIMLIGCDHSLWLMHGDPAAGGAIDMVSNSIGIVGADAAVFDPFGTVWFLTHEGLFKMEFGGRPEMVSTGILDKVFRNIDYTSNWAILTWSRQRQGLHIFITPIVEGAATHYFFDTRTQSFWKDQYPNAAGPYCATLYDADAPDDRAVLLGGFDGYIRHFDDAAASDAGTSAAVLIDSYIRIPLPPTRSDRTIRLSKIAAIIAANSNDVTLTVYTGTTPEIAATTTTIHSTYDLKAGRNLNVIQRAAENALAFELKNDTVAETWYGLETLDVTVSDLGSHKGP